MRGQAFITLASEEVAERARKETNGFLLRSKPLVVVSSRCVMFFNVLFINGRKCHCVLLFSEKSVCFRWDSNVSCHQFISQIFCAHGDSDGSKCSLIVVRYVALFHLVFPVFSFTVASLLFPRHLPDQPEPEDDSFCRCAERLCDKQPTDCTMVGVLCSITFEARKSMLHREMHPVAWIVKIQNVALNASSLVQQECLVAVA